MLDVPQEVKDLFLQNNTQKNFRIKFPNGEFEDITNSNIISESVRFTESLCSQQNLKFGLCEASVLEFETIDVGNIKGCRIEAGIEVCLDEPIKVTRKKGNLMPYSELRIEWGEPYTFRFDRPENGTFSFDFYAAGLDESGLQAYRGMNLTTNTGVEDYIAGNYYSIHLDNIQELTLEPLYSGALLSAVRFLADDNEYTEVLSGNFCIPYGVFTVDSCKRQSDMHRRKVVAYNPVVSINSKITEFEKFKRSWLMKTNLPYEYNIKDFALANTGYFNPEASVVCIASYEEASEYYPAENMHYIPENPMRLGAQVNYRRYNIYTSGGRDYTEYMHRISRPRDENFSAIMATLSSWSITKCMECKCVVTMKKTNSAKEKRQTLFIPIEEEGVIYPYVGSLADGAYARSIDLYVPDEITLNLGGTGTSGAKRYKLPEPSVLRLYNCSFPLFDEKVSIKRTKNKEGYFYANNSEIPEGNVLQSLLELGGLFGQRGRDGEVKLIKVQNSFGLYPSKDLYPSEDLYPNEAAALVSRGEYKVQSLWYEEYKVQPFGKVIVDYTDTEGNKQTLAYRFDDTAPNVYHFKDNYIFQNISMTEDRVRELMDRYFIPNISGITYTPAEVEIKGMPYLEVGDAVQILTEDNGLEFFIFRRTLSGIQALVDDIEAQGDELNEDVTGSSVTEEEE